ncbi:hypothetical protein SPB21_25600 [Leptothoe sp. ISB3NOV94-8A]
MNKIAASITCSLGIASVSAVVLAAAPVSALSITSEDSIYELTVEETTFDDLRAREDFENLVPWFGDEDLAQAVASAAGEAFADGNNELGVPDGFFGPSFAFDVDINGSIDFTTYINNERRLVEAAIPNSDLRTGVCVLELAIELCTACPYPIQSIHSNGSCPWQDSRHGLKCARIRQCARKSDLMHRNDEGWTSA